RRRPASLALLPACPALPPGVPPGVAEASARAADRCAEGGRCSHTDVRAGRPAAAASHSAAVAGMGWLRPAARDDGDGLRAAGSVGRSDDAVAVAGTADPAGLRGPALPILARAAGGARHALGGRDGRSPDAAASLERFDRGEPPPGRRIRAARPGPAPGGA